ncbi:MAG TPA: phosphotransferase [Solirubrobacteraceae bacterium]|nr:phosphotransferase [Solirubrobacteraceae bacterium]
MTPAAVPLDARSVVDFLLERGQLEPGDVLDRSLTVAEVSRRNACFAVRRGDRPGLFVKQPAADEPLALASVRREAAVARSLASDPRFGPVAALTPRLRMFDAAACVLVVDLIGDAKELAVRVRRDGELAPPLARAVGETVGALHRSGPRVLDGEPGRCEAWILTLPLLADEQLPHGCDGVADLRDAAREDPALAGGLEELRAAWTTAAFVHGDLKWENVMLGEAAGAPRVHLVDWEMGGFGDPAWDVGGLLHAYLRTWVFGMPCEPGDPAPDAADALAPARASAAALWAGYRAAAAPEPAGDFLVRSMRFAGARLLQTAFEHAVGTSALSHHAVLLAQLAANVVADPEAALATLLELEPDAAG